MSHKLSEIVYETPKYFIVTGNGYEVWEIGVCHATRKASFGSKSNLSQEWLTKAKDFIISRETIQENT